MIFSRIADEKALLSLKAPVLRVTGQDVIVWILHKAVTSYAYWNVFYKPAVLNAAVTIAWASS